jgi:ketosteroid isomerase-like protein
MDGAEVVREYYRAIDEDEYDVLSGVLTGDFVHYRPDTTVEGREAFVAFMRSGRPEPDTEHAIEAVYAAVDDDRTAAEGRLLRADGSEWFGFVDTFEIGETGIRSIRTYTDARAE